MNHQLKELDQLLNKKNLSREVKKRLRVDLNAISLRLIKNEYETSGIVENIFDVPETFKRMYKHIDTYARIAKTWSFILSTLPINDKTNLLDICPGYAPKIELALFYLGYRGTVTILDEDYTSMKQLIKFMNLFNPQFKIRTLKRNFFSPTKEKFPVVIGNHIIDDLILYYFAKKADFNINKFYENEQELTDFWKRIILDKDENQKEITQKISDILSTIIAAEGYLCLSHYKSYMDKMLDLEKEYLFSKYVLENTINNLLNSGFCLKEFQMKRSADTYFKSDSVYILKKQKRFHLGVE